MWRNVRSREGVKSWEIASAALALGMIGAILPARPAMIAAFLLLAAA
jgi:uncharacterized membrane protein YbaN (DUF454 family)